jgi:hypothetical protein
MRFTFAAATISLAFLGMGCQKSSETVLQTASTKSVNVNIICEGDSVRALISPFNVAIAEYDSSADEVAWELNDSSSVEEIQITKKPSDKKKWPYDAALPVKAKKHAAGKSGKLRHGTQDGRYGYNISASCKLASGDANIVIDPDMIIIHRLK